MLNKIGKFGFIFKKNNDEKSWLKIFYVLVVIEKIVKIFSWKSIQKLHEKENLSKSTWKTTTFKLNMQNGVELVWNWMKILKMENYKLRKYEKDIKNKWKYGKNEKLCRTNYELVVKLWRFNWKA